MSDDEPYVSVSTTITQEGIGQENHDQPIESSEIHTLAAPAEAPATPQLGAPALEWKSFITPLGTLVLGAVLALGHHTFNTWENGKPTAAKLPQYWVTWIGVGFSFGFKSAIGVTMGFVVLQCLWLSVIRQPLTIQQIDTIYRIERQDQLYKTLPHALLFSPTIVIFSALTLLLPLSGVFAPGSLAVTTKNVLDHVGPCTIPSGNISALDTPDSTSLFAVDHQGQWFSVSPRASALTLQWLVDQHIPDLPHACGPNCRYKVHVPSFFIQCTPNPSSLPYSQGNDPIGLPDGKTLWNGTLFKDETHIGFYLAWDSNNITGTSGNASCVLLQAEYDVEVQTKDGVQLVTTNLTKMMSPIPPQPPRYWPLNSSDPMVVFQLQLISIAWATQDLFLGQLDLKTLRVGNSWGSSLQAIQFSFLEMPIPGHDRSLQFIWGNVLKGIEEMSHNVTAGLLTLQLGNISSECFFDQPIVAYEYSPFALWVPYGTALGISLISLVISVMIMARNNTGDVTTSFSNTVILTRNVDEGISGGAKLRLKEVEYGKLEYVIE